MKIAVVGAGIAGLAAAVRLQAKGHQVAVFEANDFVGGKLSQFELNGYRFDAGPSLFTMPHFVEELFAEAGKNVRDYFEYQRLEVVCEYFWDDNTALTAYADAQRYAAEVEQKLGVPRQKILDALEDSRIKYESTAPIFLHRSLHKWGTYFNKDVWKVLGKMHKLQLLNTMHKANVQRFGHPKLVQLFDRYATYNGSDPHKASAVLNMIPHLEQNIGAFLPKGGMVEIAQSVYRLAQDLGVKFHLGTKVEEILVENQRATGIRTATERLAFDRVVCNMDVFFAYDRLLPNARKPMRVLRQPKSSSALIFYWGIGKHFPQLNVHNIFFANDYQREFAHIFDQKTVADDVTVYINITSKAEPADAPAHGENWFVMVNVPANEGQDWPKIIAQTRRVVLEKLSQRLGEPIEPLIEAEALLEPRTIESRTQSHLGALYGTSSNTKMAAFWRHPNFAKSIAGLYFCGGSVHPGGGIPLCLLSGKLVSELVV